MIGRLLGGRYEILSRLGGGGMAVVYKALDRLLYRPVAVKILREQYATDPEFVRRFRREAQAAAMLSHPNIVNVYDVGDDGGLHYIVMEYVEGRSLRQVLDEEGALPPERAARIAIQILDALEEAHHHGVIHRDVKPDNILLTRDERVKVADFGIARAASQATLVPTGAILGSAHYISPEQARGSPLDGRSDLYSVGVLLFQLLSGELPYDGESPVEVALKRFQEEPPDLSALAPQVPVALARVVRKAMARQPGRRYPTAGAMAEDLRACLAGRPLPHVEEEEAPADGEATLDLGRVAGRAPAAAGAAAAERPDGSARPQGRERRRRPWLWALLGALLLLLGAGGYGAWRLAGWFDVPTVRVPKVVGLTLSDATRTLQQAQLILSVADQRYSQRYPANVIISQDPPPGEAVKAGQPVRVVVSQGPEQVTVPAVTNMPQSTAETLLGARGLRVRVVQEYSDSVASGYVIDQSPAAGSPLAQGSTVTLTVSQGPSVNQVVVPALVGLGVDDALNQLRSNQLVPGKMSYQLAGYPAGTVVSTSPAAGQMVAPGSAVDLVISQGCINQAQPTVTVQGQGSQPVQVRVDLTDASGTRTIYQAAHTPGDTFQVDACWGAGDAHLKIYENDTLINPPDGDLLKGGAP
ncbi:MAG: Stk1 family PASTA domain-containing Ser/Thr kinase [Bacillota bacterium]|nr:Stk1 family PASTA domain-containing Ser/Thr kinase [Bacillota bacterium]